MGTHIRRAHGVIPDDSNVVFDRNLAIQGPLPSYEGTPPIVQDPVGFQVAVDRSKAMRQLLVDQIKHHRDHLRQKTAPDGRQPVPAPSSITLATLPPSKLAKPTVSAGHRSVQPQPGFTSSLHPRYRTQEHSEPLIHDSPAAMDVDLPLDSGPLSHSTLRPSSSEATQHGNDAEDLEQMWAVLDSSTGTCTLVSMAEIADYCDRHAASPCY